MGEPSARPVWTPSLTSQTTRSMWVLDPRAIVNAPATGQRSTRAVTVSLVIGYGRSIVRRDPFLENRGDPFAPFAAVEDAVMPDVLGKVVFLHRRRQFGRELERRL